MQRTTLSSSSSAEIMSTGMSRSARVGLQPLEHGVAVEIGHHHVEQHQVDRARGSVSSAASPPATLEDVVALARQAARQHVAVLLVVVHDQDDGTARRRRARRSDPGPALCRSALALWRDAAVVQELGEPVGSGTDALQIGKQGCRRSCSMPADARRLRPSGCARAARSGCREPPRGQAARRARAPAPRSARSAAAARRCGASASPAPSSGLPLSASSSISSSV